MTTQDKARAGTIVVSFVIAILFSINHNMNVNPNKGLVSVSLGEPDIGPAVTRTRNPTYTKHTKRQLVRLPHPKVLPAGLMRVHRAIKLNNSQFDCLARNIYHEAAREPYVGKIGVAQITFNRLKKGRWGHSVCKVVFASKQFSWTTHPALVKMKPRGKHWASSVEAANAYLRGVRVDTLVKSDHYHADYKDPIWRPTMKPTAVLGQHIFYASK
jgi:hypothetical protein